MTHGGVTILKEIAELGALERALEAVDERIQQGLYKAFGEMPGLHFASFVVWPRGDERLLLFEASFDGEAEAFLDEWVTRFPSDVHEIFRHCKGYPPSGAALPGLLRAYLGAGDRGAGTFFVGCPGRGVGQIRREEHLRGEIERFLDASRASGAAEPLPSEPEAIHRAILDRLRGIGLDGGEVISRPPFRVRHGRNLLRLGLTLLASLVAVCLAESPRFALAPLLAAIAAAAIWMLAIRWHEGRDREAIEENRAGIPAEAELAAREDRRTHVQNHMASFTRVKGGSVRLWTLRAVLAAIGFLARWLYTRGALGRIRSIHFARWVLIEQEQEHWLLFLSNYDGSWNGYLDDFVDLASEGLTPIWSNTVGFPRTRWLFWKGSRDGPRFKAWARKSMYPTRAWYSAYPQLSVRHVDDHTALREALFRPLDEAERDAMLRRL